MTGTNLYIFLQDGDIFLHDFFSLFEKGSTNRRLKNCCIKSEIAREDTEEVCILVLILDEWIDDDIISTESRSSSFDFFYPFFIGDEESSFFQS